MVASITHQFVARNHRGLRGCGGGARDVRARIDRWVECADSGKWALTLSFIVIATGDRAGGGVRDDDSGFY